MDPHILQIQQIHDTVKTLTINSELRLLEVKSLIQQTKQLFEEYDQKEKQKVEVDQPDTEANESVI